MYTPVLHFDDINGRPLVGGKLYTYEANSSTPAPTYRDKSGTLLNENPISLDERGECEVWLVDGLRYKMVLVDSIGTRIWEADNVSSMSDVSNASIDVDGTSPVKVSKSVVNGVTKYTVSLEKSFVDEVHDNTRNIVNETERAYVAEQNLSQRIDAVSGQLSTETTRAQNAEHTLSERIENVNVALSDETARAKAAEASARTVVRAGEGIQVDKVVDPFGDGHDEYFVSTYLPEATSTRFGVVKTGDDTVQAIPKNEPTRYKHRTYPVQKNADGQMVVNVPWKDGAGERYKGIVTILIQGACIDTTDPITGVASQVVSGTFADADMFPSGDNTITSITYREVAGKPSDFKPEFHIDNQGHLYYTFGEKNQEWLVFDMLVHFDTMQGFGYLDDGDVEFVANSAFVPQPVMAINQRIPVQKTIDGVGGKILDEGLILVVPKSNNLGSGYNIVLIAEYWYTSSPPEFFVFNAVDDEGDYMVDEQGDRMVIYEDNPDYVGA